MIHLERKLKLQAKRMIIKIERSKKKELSSVEFINLYKIGWYL
jgi:hypothetical protein